MKDLFAMLCIRFAKRNTPVRKRIFEMDDGKLQADESEAQGG